jgi:deazaflavin-dependent oxidoreductase (nitroreductase family)
MSGRGRQRNWADRSRPLWRIGNRVEAFQLRHLGFSTMSLLNRGDVMVLETIGRRTQRRRFTPVGYIEDVQGAFVVGGGAAGMATVPDWVRNLRANPSAAAWIRRSRLPVLARELTGAERDEAQREAIRIWPAIPRYQAKSGRTIPYFRLVPHPN